jgi:hypothetical protein
MSAPRPNDAASLLAAYSWADSDDPLVEALSITLAQPDDGRVPALLRPRRELPQQLTVEGALEATLELADFAWGVVLAQTGSCDGWAMIIEPNGWAASMPDILGRISVHGVAVNVFWNVNAVIRFSLARDGRLVREFDCLLYNSPDEPLAEEAGLPWGAAHPRASALGLMERVTGVRLERDSVLDTRRPTFEVPVAR